MAVEAYGLPHASTVFYMFIMTSICLRHLFDDSSVNGIIIWL